MRSGSKDTMPISVQRVLKKLGADIKLARRKRGMSVERTTQATGISASTLNRLERGDPTIAIGSLAMVLLSLGETQRLSDILDISTDTFGLLSDIDRLPKRIIRKKSEPESL